LKTNQLTGQALIRAVVNQIQKDLQDEDVTALWELLMNVEPKHLQAFLPEVTA
jgi:hypothetical protein